MNAIVSLYTLWHISH